MAYQKTNHSYWQIITNISDTDSFSFIGRAVLFLATSSDHIRDRMAVALCWKPWREERRYRKQ